MGPRKALATSETRQMSGQENSAEILEKKKKRYEIDYRRYTRQASLPQRWKKNRTNEQLITQADFDI